ncbi:HAD-like domain-containing protein [Apodospora peruviana]|uniref:HAD-like domain-containing protein n=1 Tax=Apodospora peruviana TaxID=516989 RepID=A0AAE0HZG3_9PEZI|nr:HAD-like domain-containing protein [Apodospora peruviana]
MGQPQTDFPAIRACIFDMDGLLLNTEDIYTLCADIVLTKYGRPPLPWSVKAQLMGVPGSANGDVFHTWAQLPISQEQFKKEQSEQQKLHFPHCEPLPGVESLLAHLNVARNRDGKPIHMALATSSERANFDLKTAKLETKRLLGYIPDNRRVMGDDTGVKRGRGKPAPDIYLLALERINATLPEGEGKIAPKECLVLEDSVPGLEAGRRAGMRAVWVPHPKLVKEFEGREEEVLAGRIGLVKIGDEHQLGEIGDRWAEQLESLEGFPYERFGIVPP